MKARIGPMLRLVAIAVMVATAPQEPRPPQLTRAAILDAVRVEYPQWTLVKSDRATTPSGWWRFRSEAQDIDLSVSVLPTLLEAADELERQNRTTQIGGACLAWPGDDGIDYSRCNGAVLRLRSASVVFQVGVWEEGGCDPELFRPGKAKRARTIADTLALRLDTLFHSHEPPNPSLQRTRFARR